MYPSDQLNELALEKELLEKRIALHRARCVVEWQTISRPIELADTVVGQLRRFAPLLKLLAVPLGFAAVRRRGSQAVPRSQSTLGKVMRWAPVVLGLVRSWRAQREMRREATEVQRRARSAV